MSVLTVGLDPGVSGAIAVLNAVEVELLADLPLMRDGRLAWIDGGTLQRLLIGALQGRSARAIVERASAMPRQGVASAFNFGVGFGSILSILQANETFQDDLNVLLADFRGMIRYRSLLAQGMVSPPYALQVDRGDFLFAFTMWISLGRVPLG